MHQAQHLMTFWSLEHHSHFFLFSIDPVNTSTEVQDEAELMASQSRIFFSDSDPARPPARLLIEKTLFLISAILVLVVGIVVRITV